jgi:hypothetical protein
MRTSQRSSNLTALITAAAIFAAFPVAASAAPSASDPGIWKLKAATTISFTYWQGISSITGSADPSLLFTGPSEGAYRTSSKLTQVAGNSSEIPATVKEAERYNHIGDGSFDQAEGGRFLLPLECYYPGAGGNTCKTGSIGVADPKSLNWRYYVKLDPSAIAKAMWVEVSPDGKYAWTSSGDDLLAFRTSDIKATNAAPSGAAIKPARTLKGALKGLGGVTGAVFWRGKLLVAGELSGRFQINSINPANGTVTLEAEHLPIGRERRARHRSRRRRAAAVADHAGNRHAAGQLLPADDDELRSCQAASAEAERARRWPQSDRRDGNRWRWSANPPCRGAAWVGARLEWP